MTPEFRFYYFTSRYDETVAFYRDVLEFEIFRSWDRSPSDRGHIFRSPNGGGLIEIEAGSSLPAIDGGFYIEMEQIDELCARIRAAGAPITREPGLTSYGHYNFRTSDPSGIQITFFRYLAPQV